MPEASLRLQLYRRLAGLTDQAAIDEMGQELVDRFGPLPEPVVNLLYVVRVKVLAVNVGVEAISQEDGQLVLKSAALEAWIASSCRASYRRKTCRHAWPAAPSGWSCGRGRVAERSHQDAGGAAVGVWSTKSRRRRRREGSRG